MGSEKFREAGLHQQTPEQLKVLEDWLLHHATDIIASQPASEASTATAAAAGTTARRSWFGFGLGGADKKAKEKADDRHSTVVSRYNGLFTGWQPGRVVELENGQKWKVNDSSSLHPRKPMDRPTITIAPGLLGSWNMKVEGYNSTARVIPAN